MRFSRVNGPGLVRALLIGLTMVSGSLDLASVGTPSSLPVCRAIRLPIEGISIFCELHITNTPLRCRICLRGKHFDEALGIATHHIPENISGVITQEACEYTYFPKRIGAHTFSVVITGISEPVLTNDVFIPDLPSLEFQKTCQDGLMRVTCKGTWYLATPFLRMSLDGIDASEIHIRSLKNEGNKDTYLTEAVMSIGKEEQKGSVNVTCEAVYAVQSHFRHIYYSITLNFNASRREVQISLVKISDSELQCTADVPHTNLILHCTTSFNTTVLRRFGESPLSVNISVIGYFRSVKCVCTENITDACYSNAETNVIFEQTFKENSMNLATNGIVPIIRDMNGLHVNSTYEINEGTIATFQCFTDINEIRTQLVTVKCWNQDGETIISNIRDSMPVKFNIPGNAFYNRSSCLCQISSTFDHWPPTTFFIILVNGHQPAIPIVADSENRSQDGASGRGVFGYYIFAGLVLFAILSLVISVYLYLKERQGIYATRSASSPTQSNEYASIGSPKSSKSSSTPQETCTLLDHSSCPPDSSGDSGSGGSSRSNQYFTDSPVDSETRSSDLTQSPPSINMHIA